MQQMSSSLPLHLNVQQEQDDYAALRHDGTGKEPNAASPAAAAAAAAAVSPKTPSASSVFRQLPHTASAGDVEAVQQLLDQCTPGDPEAAGAAAYLAALNGQLNVMRLLLLHGTAAQHRGGPAPLHAAALRGHADAVQLLLDSGAPPGCKAEDGITALHAGELHYWVALYGQNLLSLIETGLSQGLLIPSEAVPGSSQQRPVCSLLQAACGAAAHCLHSAADSHFACAHIMLYD
jgi:ankyrin repeat protein